MTKDQQRFSDNALNFTVITQGTSADMKRIEFDLAQRHPDHSVAAPDLRTALALSKLPGVSMVLVDEIPFLGIDPSLRTRLVLESNLRVLVLLSRRPHTKRDALLRAGVAGLLDFDVTVDELMFACARIAAGEIWASRRLMSETLRAVLPLIKNPRFTRREIEVLRRIAAGKDNRQIACELFVTRETVRWHLRSAYAKLGVHDRELAATLFNQSRAGDEGAPII